MAYLRISPQPVTEGGTGISSASPFAVITGGTTSTGPLQQVSGTGSSGNVLVSGGASALPAWQATSGSGWVLIQSQTVSGVTQVNFTTGINSTYDNYVLIISNGTGDGLMQIFPLGMGGTALFLGGNGSIQYHILTSSGWSTDPTPGFATLPNGTLIDVSMTVYMMGLATISPCFMGRATYTVSSGVPYQNIFGWAFYDNSGGAMVADAIRISYTSGNPFSGTYSLYGITK